MSGKNVTPGGPVTLPLAPLMLYEGDFSSTGRPVRAGRGPVQRVRRRSTRRRARLDALHRHGVADDRIDLVRVPGSFEIPLVAQKLGKSGKYAAVICLGCVIRGDTDHYDHVAGAATSGIATAALNCGVPVIFGVLTCDTLEQAIHRAGGEGRQQGLRGRRRPRSRW